jgi:hypothetical protein
MDATVENARKEITMTRKLIATVGAVAVFGVVGAGAASAAGNPSPGSGSRADCPYSTTNTPLRIHAQDGSGQNARPGAPLHLQDGTGPHNPWAGGR